MHRAGTVLWLSAHLIFVSRFCQQISLVSRFVFCQQIFLASRFTFCQQILSAVLTFVRGMTHVPTDGTSPLIVG
jgi:hypothetical protein